jgi:HK97 family phage major capsid protein
MSDLLEIKKALDETMGNIKSAVETQQAEIKKYGETQSATAKAIAEHNARFDEIQAEMKGRMDQLEAGLNRPQQGQSAESKSIGERFTNSEEYKSFMAKGGRGESGNVELKDITGASASAGGLIPEYRVPTVFANPDRPLFVRQLVNNSTCAGDSVTIMRENVFTNNAGPQYNVAGNPVNQLVDKNKSDITYTSANVPVRTMAHHIIASRQVLSDAPRLRAMIDQRLPYGLNLNMDNQLLYGDGLTENFTGLFVDAGVNDVGEIATGTTADDLPLAMIKHLRAAVTKCQLSEFYNVNGLILSPTDWETIETATATDGKFIWVNVNTGGEQRMWRVPVIVSNAVQTGDFLLGDWSMGATLYQREGLTVRASESHANLFIQNGVAILGEERAAFAVELPKAFTKGSFAVAGA